MVQDKDAEEWLAHYGVKGMKWGKRTAKPTNSQIIGARRRLISETNKVNRLDDKVASAKTSKDRDKALKEYNKANLALLKNPDRVTAARMSTGEKYAVAIASVGFTPAVGAGYVAGKTAARKTIERRQRTGYYDRQASGS